jgi:hypothetical protein
MKHGEEQELRVPDDWQDLLSESVPMTEGMIKKAAELARGVDVDLDEPLDSDNE